MNEQHAAVLKDVKAHNFGEEVLSDAKSEADGLGPPPSVTEYSSTRNNKDRFDKENL